MSGVAARLREGDIPSSSAMACRSPCGGLLRSPRLGLAQHKLSKSSCLGGFCYPKVILIVLKDFLSLSFVWMKS